MTKKNVGPQDAELILQIAREVIAATRHKRPDRQSGAELLKCLKKLVPYDAATLFWFDQTRQALETAATVGGEVKILNFVRLEGGAGISGWTALNKKPFLLADRSKTKQFDPENDYASFMTIPLVSDDDVIGAISFGAKEPNVFDEAMLKRVMYTGEQLVVSLEKLHFQERARLLENRLRKAEEQLKSSRNLLVQPSFAQDLKRNVSGVIHEINNSLSVIVGNIQCMLAQGAAANQKMLSRLKRIEGAAEKISSANGRILSIYGSVSNSAETTATNSNEKSPVIQHVKL
ncbi:MAG TPA: GAF domain-containing protein [candidate division Zixibacteria bacterium]|nr:GAF domain-containing protein [candidate division Zixibacteria bacterium]